MENATFVFAYSEEINGRVVAYVNRNVESLTENVKTAIAEGDNTKGAVEEAWKTEWNSFHNNVLFMLENDESGDEGDEGDTNGTLNGVGSRKQKK